MLRRLTGNPTLADDLLQDTLALTLTKIRQGEVREPERLAGFVRSLARNLWIADRRKEARYVALDDGEEEESPVRQIADPGPAPSDLALANEEAKQVRRLLSEMRFDRDRQLLQRFYLGEQSREQICEDLDLEPERFNQLIFRARERLRDLWERAEKRRRFFHRVGRFIGRKEEDPSPSAQVRSD
jgi:RNA polymerase sigma-70 factor (ECF subfamily)